jgi:hypothetical protein
MGLLGLWTGVAAGGTAALAGRLTGRIWWPIHKVAVLALIAVWLHGVFAGSDAHVLRWLYLGSGILVALFAWWRYGKRRPSDVDVHGDAGGRPNGADVIEAHASESKIRDDLARRGA